MLAILNSLYAHNLPIFQPFLIILVSKFMVHRGLSDKTYLLLGLLSPLSTGSIHVIVLVHLYGDTFLISRMKHLFLRGQKNFFQSWVQKHKM